MAPIFPLLQKYHFFWKGNTRPYCVVIFSLSIFSPVLLVWSKQFKRAGACVHVCFLWVVSMCCAASHVIWTDGVVDLFSRNCRLLALHVYLVDYCEMPQAKAIHFSSTLWTCSKISVFLSLNNASGCFPLFHSCVVEIYLSYWNANSWFLSSVVCANQEYARDVCTSSSELPPLCGLLLHVVSRSGPTLRYSIY